MAMERPRTPTAATAPSRSFSFAEHPLTVTQGASDPAGGEPDVGRLNFARHQPACDGGHAGAVRAVRRRRAWRRSRWTPTSHRTGDHWHVRVRGCRRRSATAIGSRGRPGRCTGMTRASSCWTRRRGALVRPAVGQPDDQPEAEPDQRGARVRPGGRPPVHPPRGHDPLRVARPRVHRRPVQRVRHPGTFAGLIEKILPENRWA